MKNLFLTILAVSISIISFSQWTYERVDNGFDEPYRIAYTKTNNGSFLKLENVEGAIAFYLQGGYFCDETPFVEMSFLVGNEYQKFYKESVLGDDNDIIFIMSDIVPLEALKYIAISFCLFPGRSQQCRDPLDART